MYQVSLFESVGAASDSSQSLSSSRCSYSKRTHFHRFFLASLFLLIFPLLLSVGLCDASDWKEEEDIILPLNHPNPHHHPQIHPKRKQQEFSEEHPLHFATRMYKEPDSNPVMMSMTVGNYRAVDGSDTEVIRAAHFAVEELQTHPSSPFHLGDGGSRSNYSFRIPPKNKEDLRIHVLQAFQQVVAGMNYKLLIAVFQNETCIGGFHVIVYNQFGTLSVTEWGDEVSCDVIETRMKTNERR